MDIMTEGKERKGRVFRVFRHFIY